MTDKLAERLKSETRSLHRAAERSAFMGALLQGRLARRPYALLLRSLHTIYAALEDGLTAHASTQPAIALVWTPSLGRRAALAHDLVALAGPDWAHELEVQAAARDYSSHLQRLGREAPVRLVAHAYVRYLGDLNGGQALARIVARSLGLPPGRATCFYDFGGATAVDRLMHDFRAGLAALGGDTLRDDALVDEARLAFALHLDLFDELARTVGLADAAAVGQAAAAG